MARREVTDCDRCGAKSVAEPVRLCVRVGWLSDPAGGSGDYDREDVDLCPKCAAALLSAAVNALGHEQAKKWVEDARKKVK